MHIAIDGPAAAGKGTVAKLLSDKLEIPCLDTGAIYRGIAITAIGILTPGFTSAQVSQFLGKLEHTKIAAKIIDNVTHIIVNGTDVTDQLRLNQISQMASLVGTIPAVRKLCTQISQDLAATCSLIAEGRDICSVVLPNAKYKFYLTADASIRAKRRYDELVARGAKADYNTVLHETLERDERDATKGGLVQTPDAILVDSTNLTVDQVVEHMLGYIS